MLHHEARGAGPAVLLVHAGIADSRMWTPLADALARDHFVIAPDLRGFGRSTLEPGRLSHPDDLLALLDALGVDRAAVVAASMGGAVALEVVLAAPERVSALALLDSAVDELDPSPPLAAYWEAEEAAIEAGDDETAIELTLRTWVDGHGRDGEPDPEVRALVATMYRDSLAAQRGVVVEEDEVPARSPPGRDQRAGARDRRRARRRGLRRHRAPAGRAAAERPPARDDPRRRPPSRARATGRGGPGAARVPRRGRGQRPRSGMTAAWSSGRAPEITTPSSVTDAGCGR